MAVAPTGAIYKSLVFDGESSRDYGIYITGQAVYNAPERDVEMINIPGRNGSFALDKGRFQNIEVTYPAGIFADNEADFAQGISDFRNFLCSRNGYVRLTDDYNPDEYRMAVYKSGLDVSPAQLKAGEFKIVFDCKPQRYLLSGEEAITIGEWHETETASGEIASFEAVDGDAVKSLVADIEPIQNGEPWMSALNAEPYQFRQVPTQSHEFGYEIDKIVGGTVAWNQLVQNGNFADTTKWVKASGALAVANNVGTFTANASAQYHGIYQNISVKSGHKYFVNCDFKVTTESSSVTKIRVVFSNGANGDTTWVAKGSGWQNASYIKSMTSDWSQMYIITEYGLTIAVGDTIEYKNVQLIDLTQMFGSTIADYIYSLEQATAGAGVAWFRKLFPKPYYAYNAGELKSVSGVSSHDMVGFNQWDEEWESGTIIPSTGEPAPDSSMIRSKNFIKVVPNATYWYFNGSNENCRIFYYDADKNYTGVYFDRISGQGFTITNNVGYIKFRPNSTYGTTYKNDICINLSWDGERNGEYEPYELHSYPLDTDLTLRGIPKLDANNNLYYDGDVYEPDGTVTRKYKHVTSFSRGSVDSSGKLYAVAFTGAAAAGTGDRGVSNKLPCVDLNGCRNNATNGIKSFCAYGTSIYVGGYVGEESALDTMLNGFEVVYELATPTTETADTFTNPQVVDRYGTEEYVISDGTFAVPVGHSTNYANICPIYPNWIAEINRAGKNLLVTTLTSGSEYTDNGVTYTVKSDGSIVATGRAWPLTSVLELCSDVQEQRLVDIDDTLEIWGGTENADVEWYNYDGSHTATSRNGSHAYLRPTTTLGKIRIKIAAGTEVSREVIRPMLTRGLADATYEPCKSDTYSVDLNAARWGGTLDVVSGVLTVDRQIVTYNGTENWTAHLGGNGRFYLNSLPSGLDTSKKTESISNIATYKDDQFAYGAFFSFGGSGVYFTKSSASDTLDAFKARCASNNAQIVYPITPTTVQLAAQEVELLVGLNQIWANSGDVSVEYGTRPSAVYNPTLFESSPMLEVTGYGEIGVGDDTIVVNDTAIGDIYISEGGTITRRDNELSITLPITFETRDLNGGDKFYISDATATIQSTVKSGYTTDGCSASSFDTAATTNATGTSKAMRIKYSMIFIYNEGTLPAQSDSNTATFFDRWTHGGTAGSNNAIFTISGSYTGGNTLTLTLTIQLSECFDNLTVKSLTLPRVRAKSTKSALGTPTYIDLDIGEAWNADSGEPVSANNVVIFPSTLPTLKPGVTEFSLPGSVTDLKVVPRFWKI